MPARQTAGIGQPTLEKSARHEEEAQRKVGEAHRAQTTDLAGVLGEAERGGVERAEDDRAQGEGRGDPGQGGNVLGDLVVALGVAVLEEDRVALHAGIGLQPAAQGFQVRARSGLDDHGLVAGVAP